VLAADRIHSVADFVCEFELVADFGKFVNGLPINF